MYVQFTSCVYGVYNVAEDILPVNFTKVLRIQNIAKRKLL